MIGSPTATIDLARVRDNAIRIARDGGVPVIAVIKSDAYGLGAAQVVRAIGDVVDGFYCFSLDEAIAARTVDTAKPTIALMGDDLQLLKHHRVRPAVWTIERAQLLREARPVLSVDTSMQRFACPSDQIDAVVEAGRCDEAFTHATKVDHARLLRELCPKLRLHAASSSLLEISEARLDAVRPGLALYHDAVRITAQLIETRDTRQPFGYGGSVSKTGRIGVIVGGFTTGVKPARCAINGEVRRILESGMQTSFVEIGPRDKVEDEVVLLGDSVLLEDISRDRNTTQQETLWRLTAHAARSYSKS